MLRVDGLVRGCSGGKASLSSKRLSDLVSDTATRGKGYTLRNSGEWIGSRPAPLRLSANEREGRGLLVLENLNKRYGEVVALDGCSLSVRRGRMVGFLGPNGAGKTSAMRAVFGLLNLDGGTVTWEDRPVGMEARRRFGYMPEMRGLYPRMKARSQLIYKGRLHGMHKNAATEAADFWLDRVGLEDRANSKLEELSHGNQQRVQLAAALLHNPELLVLDEPFSGLDPLGVDDMARILKQRAESGAAVLFSSHQLDLVEDLCDDVAIIHRGRVVVAGEVRSLKDRAGYRRLELDVDGPSGFIHRIEGSQILETRGTRYTLLVPSGTDVHHLYGLVQERARIREFSYRPPTLTDLFKQAVAE